MRTMAMNSKGEMKMKIVKVKYDHSSKAIHISCDGDVFDTSKINGMDITEWSNPFILKGVKWNGFYEEIKSFYNMEDFSVLFIGDSSDLDTLRSSLADEDIKVEGLNNKVFILYNGDTRSTKITVNGKVFDTSRLINRTVDEWVFPFQVNGIIWNGIFAELESYIGGRAYSIQFVGKKEDMQYIEEQCPEFVELKFKEPISSAPKPAAPKNDNNDLSAKFNIKVPDTDVAKNKLAKLIIDIKKEYVELCANESKLAVFGRVACVIAVICCIIFTIFMSRLLMILSIIPAIIFCVLAFTKGYKRLAVSTFAVCILLAVISWIIINIRWHLAFKDIEDSFDDINDALEDANDALGGMNDALYGNN